jgi:hypothetical protein
MNFVADHWLKLSGVRVREEIEPLGLDGGKSIVDDYLREIRSSFLARAARTPPARVGLRTGGRTNREATTSARTTIASNIRST